MLDRNSLAENRGILIAPEIAIFPGIEARPEKEHGYKCRINERCFLVMAVLSTVIN